MIDLEIDIITRRLKTSVPMRKIYEYEENIRVLIINSNSEKEDS